MRALLQLVFVGGVALLLLPAIWPSAPTTFLLRYDLFAWGTVTSITYVALLLVLLNAQGWLQRALGHPALLRIATLGYGIYLIHVPICALCVAPFAKRIGEGVGPVGAWALSLAALVTLSAVGAYVLHVVVEKPFLALRNRVAP